MMEAGSNPMRPIHVLSLAFLAWLPVPLAAQPRPKPPAPVAAPATDVPAAPQQTTATFGDWILRCTLPVPGAKSCEIVQGISSQDRTVAQIALGRPAKGQPLQMTILVPPSVSLTGPATLATAKDGDPPMLELPWQRCLPGGCVATASVADDLQRRLRGLADPARIVFVDGAPRRVGLPLSPKGLPQALDALAKADAE